MKKTRTANANKKPAPKAPRAKKLIAAAPKDGSRPSSPNRTAKTNQMTVDKAGEDLDKLTSGIKKITLVTKHQKEARMKGDATAPESAKDIVLPPSTPEPIRQQPSPPQEIMSQTSLPQELTLPTSREDTKMGPPPVPSSPTPDVFIPYQPEGPAPMTVSAQEPLKWLPPNTSTPSPVKRQPDLAFITPSPYRQADAAMISPSPMTQADLAGMVSPSLMRRADLPVFTSTSQIPFGPRTPSGPAPAPMSPTAKTETRQDDAIWEVPETPE